VALAQVRNSSALRSFGPLLPCSLLYAHQSLNTHRTSVVAPTRVHQLASHESTRAEGRDERSENREPATTQLSCSRQQSEHFLHTHICRERHAVCAHRGEFRVCAPLRWRLVARGANKGVFCALSCLCSILSHLPLLPLLPALLCLSCVIIRSLSIALLICCFTHVHRVVPWAT
jgi:hypothetical protein